jgi:hypothetical protein
MRAGYVSVTCYLPRVLVDALRQEARRTHRTPSAAIIVAVERLLEWDDGV